MCQPRWLLNKVPKLHILSLHYFTHAKRKLYFFAHYKGIVSVSDCSLKLCSFSSLSLIKSTFWQSTPTCQIIEMSLENGCVLVSADGAAQPVWWTHHNLYLPELNYSCEWDNFIESACYFRGYNIIRWITQSTWHTAFKGFQVSEWNLNQVYWQNFSQTRIFFFYRMPWISMC